MHARVFFLSLTAPFLTYEHQNCQNITESICGTLLRIPDTGREERYLGVIMIFYIVNGGVGLFISFDRARGFPTSFQEDPL